jgi:hypothetical protein
MTSISSAQTHLSGNGLEEFLGRPGRYKVMAERLRGSGAGNDAREVAR